MADLTLEQLEQELHRREEQEREALQGRFSPYAQDGFWEYLKWIAPDWYNDKRWILKELASVFHKITLGEIIKVCISIFPGAGKTRTTSLWMSWMLGYDKNCTFMRNAYNESLALTFSKSVMDILKMENYRWLFPNVKLDPQEKSKAGWSLHGSDVMTYFGTGIGGGITGRRARTALVLDDPIKNAEEALSDAYMIETLEPFIEGVTNSRIDLNFIDTCAQIIIMTRWSKSDPVGQRQELDDWTHFVFPALDEDDKSVCEDLFPTEKLLEIRNGMFRKGLDWMWYALYQQIPIDKDKIEFDPDSLQYFEMADITEMRRRGVQFEPIAFLDYADKGTDFLSFPVALVYKDVAYIVDVVFSDSSSSELEADVVSKFQEWKILRATFESNAGGEEYARIIETLLEKLMIPISEDKSVNFMDLYGTTILTQRATTNKQVRIQLQSGTIKQLTRFLKRNERSDEYDTFFNQLISYKKTGKNKHDDAPDSLAGLRSMIDDDVEGEISFIDFGKKNVDKKTASDNSDADDDSGCSECEIFVI